MQNNSDKDDGDEVNIMASEHNGTSVDKKGIPKEHHKRIHIHIC